MNHDDTFPEVLETWLSEGSAEEDPYRIMDRALARVDATPQSRFGSLTGVLGFFDSTIRVAAAAMAVALVALAGLAIFASGTFVGGPGPQGSSDPSVASAAPSEPMAGVILGLPPLGATPSDASSGELVLRFESSSTSRADTIWVYADGRMIWAPFQSTPPPFRRGEDADAAYTGFVEQRLSAAGVAFLRDQVAASGLFDDDLVIQRATSNPGYFQTALLVGDRLVKVTWAWEGIAGGEPLATDEQVSALEAINNLFRDQSSWPSKAWVDETLAAWVPSAYAICIGVRPDGAVPGEWTGPVDPSEVHALLPQAAQELLAAGEPTTDNEGMHDDAGCTVLTTDAARALAASFEGTAVRRSEPASKYFVAYEYLNPTPAWDSFWIQFGPVLPHGNAVWLGPG